MKVKNRPLNNVKILSINVLLDFFCRSSDQCCNTIKTFVNVFKKVFDTSNIGEHLDVNMCIKHLGKVRVVGHHPSVVVRKAIWSLSKRLTITSLTIDRVTVFAFSPWKKLACNVSYIHRSPCKVRWGILGHMVRATNIL